MYIYIYIYIYIYSRLVRELGIRKLRVVDQFVSYFKDIITGSS